MTNQTMRTQGRVSKYHQRAPPSLGTREKIGVRPCNREGTNFDKQSLAASS